MSLRNQRIAPARARSLMFKQTGHDAWVAVIHDARPAEGVYHLPRTQITSDLLKTVYRLRICALTCAKDITKSSDKGLRQSLNSSLL